MSPEIHSPQQQSNIAYLSDVLNETSKGLKLCAFYDENKCFQEEQRIMLIDTIARYFDDKNINLTLSLSYKLEDEIIDRFPSEKKVSIFTLFLTIIPS